MWASGLWKDKRYAACVFAGARCKSQCLRHNLDEIDDWPVMDCHHSHDPEEWAPSVVNGKRVFPSKEEAEYTAPLAFSVAIAASWWAARTGLAKLHVPRMPAIQTTGRREHWLQMDPRCMREWAMTPLAISLGLAPLDPGEASRVPARARVEEVLQPTGELPPNHIYVGQGHHSHRLPLSMWASPFTTGHDCSEDAWFCLYVNHVCSTLWDQLPSLHGHIGSCHQICHTRCHRGYSRGGHLHLLGAPSTFLAVAACCCPMPGSAADSLLLGHQCTAVLSLWTWRLVLALRVLESLTQLRTIFHRLGHLATIDGLSQLELTRGRSGTCRATLLVLLCSHVLFRTEDCRSREPMRISSSHGVPHHLPQCKL